MDRITEVTKPETSSAADREGTTGVLAIHWVYPLPGAGAEAAVSIKSRDGERREAATRVTLFNRRKSTLGRSSQCDISFSPKDSSTTSGLHAAVEVEGGTARLTGLSNTNPTFVNGGAVSEGGHPLIAGDVVRVGAWVGVVVNAEWYSPKTLDDLKREFDIQASYAFDDAPAARFEISDSYPFWRLGAASDLFGGPRLANALLLARRAAHKGAAAPLNILLEGPTGVGKEQLTRAIHDWSERGGPYIGVAAAAIPSGLAESELFGHVSNVIPGAPPRKGHFQEADRGTLLLDDVDALPLEMQPKLNRVLQEGEVIPVGSSHAIKVNVLVVAASSRPLRERVAEGRFRDDLLARIGGFYVRVPALAERREDICSLFHVLYKKLNPKLPELTARFVERLCLFPWPRNVRSLRNVVQRLEAGSTTGILTVEELEKALAPECDTVEPVRKPLLTSSPPPERAPSVPARSAPAEEEPLGERVKRCLATLQRTRDVLATAQEAGLPNEEAYTSLRGLLKQYGRERRSEAEQLLRTLAEIAVEGVLNSWRTHPTLTDAARVFGFRNGSHFHNVLADHYATISAQHSARAQRFRDERPAEREARRPGAVPSGSNGAH